MTKQRSADQRVQELEAKIAAIRARDERKQQRAKPEVQHAIAAARALDRAAAEAEDPATQAVFEEARQMLASVVTLPMPREAAAQVTPTKRTRKPKATSAA